MKKLTLLLTLLIPVFTFSQIINIPDDYPTIQEGIDAAVNGDTVLVDTGTYFENINFNGKNIMVASNFLLTLDTVYISQTIIDAVGSGSVVSFENGENSTASLKGFTITHGWSATGGGIYCNSSSPSLQNLIIKNNKAYTWLGNCSGGGIYCYYANPAMEDILVINNESVDKGGGIALNNSDPVLVNLRIIENFSWIGGGITCYNSNPILINVAINNNAATIGTGGIGGGFDLTNSNLLLVNVSMIGNFAGSSCGGAYLSNNSKITLINSILWDNSPMEFVFDGDNEPSQIVISYSNIEGGMDSIVGSNGEVNWLEGNIDQDPLFVGSGNHPCQINDYSPCIDAGTLSTSGFNLPENDLAGEVRIFNERVDMGAYEWNTFVGIDNSSMPENNNFQVKTYPNPFTSELILEYTLKRPETTIITFYNQFGKQVDVIEERQQIGLNKVVWTPKNLPVGIYYFRLHIGEQVVSGKVVLVK